MGRLHEAIVQASPDQRREPFVHDFPVNPRSHLVGRRGPEVENADPNKRQTVGQTRTFSPLLLRRDMLSFAMATSSDQYTLTTRTDFRFGFRMHKHAHAPSTETETETDTP